MRLETFTRNFKSTSEATASFHANASKGYYQTDNDGNRTFIAYDKQEIGKIHDLISPHRKRYQHMKWTKTHDWKDQSKAKKSRWKETKIVGGFNTSPK